MRMLCCSFALHRTGSTVYMRILRRLSHLYQLYLISMFPSVYVSCMTRTVTTQPNKREDLNLKMLRFEFFCLIKLGT